MEFANSIIVSFLNDFLGWNGFEEILLNKISLNLLSLEIFDSKIFSPSFFPNNASKPLPKTFFYPSLFTVILFFEINSCAKFI